MTEAAVGRAEERCAVVGIGYVGLTLLCALGRGGLRSVGYDINAEKVEKAGRGEIPFEGADAELEELLREVVAKGMISTTADPAALSEATAVFYAVETPVDPFDNKPKYAALRAALNVTAPHLSPGVLIVIESTIAPGTMSKLVLPAIEHTRGWKVGVDFNLVHCPERVMPSRLVRNISTCDRVVGGVTPACAERALPIYRRITSGKLHPTSALAAEITKTAENAYRDVQIAFANELAMICEELGADVYEVRELVNSSPGRDVHLPGAGVGGHCIPKDPWLLCSSVTEFRPTLMPAARKINDGMPVHVAKLVAQALEAEGRSIPGAVVTLLGAAYLEDTDDVRNAPALTLARKLRDLGAEVRIVDPHVSALEEFPVCPDLSVAEGSDALAVVTGHTAFKNADLTKLGARMRTRILVDGRNVFSAEAASAAGFRFSGVGRGS
jgi:UDP-N-acetyl-D-mannosaminuronic acid dehydrogenase